MKDNQLRARKGGNADVFDFDLTRDELAVIDRLETDHGGPEPADVTLESSGRDFPEP
jgi:diketogulonate reductase-like aldo/keto reductase